MKKITLCFVVSPVGRTFRRPGKKKDTRQVSFGLDQPIWLSFSVSALFL